MSQKSAGLKLILLAPMLVATLVALVLADPNPPTTEPADDDAAAKSGFSYKLLTPEQISRIRYMELRGIRKEDREPDRVTVKISKDVIDEFLLSMEGHEDFRENKAKRDFLKMTPPQKLHVMAKYKGPAFADKVLITSDPELFIEFKKNVLPNVLRGCATSACHTGTNRDAKGFALFNDPKRTAQSIYSNFILLNDLRIGNHSVINRSQPTESLLLTYLLPRNEVEAEFRHPGDVEFAPLFQSRKHNRYQRILKWIEALKHPAEDYGVHLIEPKPAETEEPPATQPAQPTGQNDADKPKPANPQFNFLLLHRAAMPHREPDRVDPGPVREGPVYDCAKIIEYRISGMEFF